MGEDEGFGGVVGIEEGTGDPGGGGGDVEDAALSALDHGWEEEAVELEEGEDVDMEELDLGLEIGLCEGAVDAEAGVIDEDFNGDGFGSEFMEDLEWGGGVGEVLGDDLGADGELLDAGIAEAFHRLWIAGDEDEVVVVLREDGCEVKTDTAGGAGDESRGHSVEKVTIGGWGAATG